MQVDRVPGLENREVFSMINFKTLSPRRDFVFTTKLYAAQRGAQIKNVMTIDLEEWFHVSNFESYLTRNSWEQLPYRIPHSVPRLLDLLARYDAKATFFCLGWVAQRFPSLIKRIQAEGHELASHGDEHRRVTSLTADEFRTQLVRSKDIIEQIGGERVYGHRAPSYSLKASTKWAFEILLESGFTYDSSIFPFGKRKVSELCDSRFPCYIPVGSKRLTEYPLSTLRMMNTNIPIAGGGYFRLLPYPFIKWSIEQLNKEGRTAIMYLHPWELDPEQPRVHQASWLAKFRHYHQLEKTSEKLTSLLQDFSFGSFRDVFWSERKNAYDIHAQF
jgi:polysaccharide deacetylase family protein (PEP-CTERM system associated)